MMTETTTIQQQIFSCETRADKKNLLKELSKTAKLIIADNGTDNSVNSILIEMYTNEEHQKFNNFWQWKKLGFKVKKEAKAFFVWSKKRKGIDRKEGEDDKEFSFFSLAYLFSNAQVEPIK